MKNGWDRAKERMEIIACLKEMREACAACFRVIYSGHLSHDLGKELTVLKIKDGFGIRCQELIRKLQGDKENQ